MTPKSTSNFLILFDLILYMMYLCMIHIVTTSQSQSKQMKIVFLQQQKRRKSWAKFSFKNQLPELISIEIKCETIYNIG